MLSSLLWTNQGDIRDLLWRRRIADDFPPKTIQWFFSQDSIQRQRESEISILSVNCFYRTREASSEVVSEVVDEVSHRETLTRKKTTTRWRGEFLVSIFSILHGTRGWHSDVTSRDYSCSEEIWDMWYEFHTTLLYSHMKSPICILVEEDKRRSYQPL